MFNLKHVSSSSSDISSRPNQFSFIRSIWNPNFFVPFETHLSSSSDISSPPNHRFRVCSPSLHLIRPILHLSFSFAQLSLLNKWFKVQLLNRISLGPTRGWGPLFKTWIKSLRETYLLTLVGVNYVLYLMSPIIHPILPWNGRFNEPTLMSCHHLCRSKNNLVRTRIHSFKIKPRVLSLLALRLKFNKVQIY